jgi:hypothetical protein
VRSLRSDRHRDGDGHCCVLPLCVPGKGSLRASLKSSQALVDEVADLMRATAPPAPGGSFLLKAPRQLDHSVLRYLVTLNNDPAWHGATVILVCRDWDTVLSACNLAPCLRLIVRHTTHPVRC